MLLSDRQISFLPGSRAEGPLIAHANFLTESGCEELQGYLFSPPVPADEFTRFLEREKPA